MKTNHTMVFLVFLVFFVISLLTNILGPIIPDIISSFELSLGMAGFLPFSFFIAYGVMSIPSGMLVERHGEKKVIAAAFLVAFLGSLAFALLPVFKVGLLSLFLIGIGMAILQVAINPLLRVAGGEAHFAFNSVMAQLIFGLASFISPEIYSYLVSGLGRHARHGDGNLLIAGLSRMVPAGLPWISLYWVFAVTTLLMVAVVLALRFPPVERKEDERAGAWATHLELLRNRQVLLYFLGIFCYVGTEQGVANWISKFLQDYHHVDPQTLGARVVGNFWLMMTLGCLLGLVLLKLFDSRKVLIGASVASMVMLAVALLGPVEMVSFRFWLPLVGGFRMTVYYFGVVGFCLSVMWSIIFSLALNSVERHHGSFSGILCTGIIGGAIVPLLVGALGDLLGLRLSMLLLYLTLAYILAIGFWARPLIANATLLAKKETAC